MTALHRVTSHPRLLLAFVGLAALVALSGCSAAGSLSLDPVETDAAVGNEATVGMDRIGLHDETDLTEQIRTATEDGSVVIDNWSHPPVRLDRPLLVDGTVYDLNYTVVASREVPSATVFVDSNASMAPAGTSEIRYGDLPPEDREAVDRLLDLTADRDDPDGAELSRSALYERPDESVLLGAETVVVRDGERFLVTVERAGTQTVSDYRYTATRVDSVAGYGASLREQYAFTLSDLSNGERSILQEARDDTYYAESDTDEAFARLSDRFRAHERVVGEDAHGGWLVRWDGRLYWAELRYGGFEN